MMNGELSKTLRTARIDRLDEKGLGIGATETGGTVAVPYVIPGETVEAKKLRRRQSELSRILEASPHRVEPSCRHFGRCGGCVWQHIDYSHQLRLKQDCIARLWNEAGVELALSAIPIVPSPPFHYRNRMDFVWSYDGRFGLREKGKWRFIVNLEECRLLPPRAMEAALEINRRVQAAGLPFRDQQKGVAGLRYLVIRCGIFTTEVMASFVTDPMQLPTSLWEGLQLASVYQLVNDNSQNDLSSGVPVHLAGTPYYRERIAGRIFPIAPETFFQPNPAVAEKMVEYVREQVAAINDTPRRLLDLYCGLGLFSLSASDIVENALGIESHPQSIRLAQESAAGTNIHYICSEAERLQPEIFDGFDALIVDPPRAGMHPRVLETIQRFPLRDIFYVSCNPKQGVKDLAQFLPQYSLVSMKLFDQFPQTPHVEMIVHLKKEQYKVLIKM